ncbi:MAG TPA: hypothetical protein VFV99_06420 [Kofleriaceae bacterium]|nr:hypothetical protein [Kofleriaceae bacterium]
MKRLLYVGFLSLPLVGCYGGERRESGKCPAGELCSDLTPGGLDFVGNGLIGELLLSGPRPTAIGGTQAVALEYDRGDGVDVALDLPFSADDDGAAGVKVDATSGSQVIVRGMGSRSNYLRILDSDGLLMDRKELTGAALDTMELVPGWFESVPADKLIAFAPGKRELGVALYGDVQGTGGPRSERLIDTSMELTLAGSTRKAWDTLEVEAVVGTTSLAVTAGDKPTANLDIVVADHADTVSLIQPAPTTVMPNSSASVCFQANTGGRYLAGLNWTYVVDGGEPVVKGDGIFTRNCISVSTQKTSGIIIVQASAGGQSAQTQLTIGAGARTTPRESVLAGTPVRAASHATATAGDRAAM